MDLYRRRRGEWVRSVRSSVGNDGFLSFPGNGGRGSGDEGGVVRDGKGLAVDGDKTRKGRHGRGNGKQLLQSEAEATIRNGGPEGRKAKRMEEGQGHGSQGHVTGYGGNRAYTDSAAPTSKSRLALARERFVKARERKEREAVRNGGANGNAGTAGTTTTGTE